MKPISSKETKKLFEDSYLVEIQRLQKVHKNLIKSINETIIRDSRIHKENAINSVYVKIVLNLHKKRDFIKEITMLYSHYGFKVKFDIPNTENNRGNVFAFLQLNW